MTEVKLLKNKELYIKEAEIIGIANEAVFKAKEKNKELGLPEFFTKNGILYFVLPSGEITKQVPEIMK